MGYTKTWLGNVGEPLCLPPLLLCLQQEQHSGTWDDASHLCKAIESSKNVFSQLLSRPKNHISTEETWHGKGEAHL